MSGSFTAAKSKVVGPGHEWGNLQLESYSCRIRLCSATCDWIRSSSCACVSNYRQYLVNGYSAKKDVKQITSCEAREMIRLSSHADYVVVSVYRMVSVHERRSQLQLLHLLHHHSL